MVKKPTKDIRLLLVQSAFTLCSALIVIKLFYIQIIKNKDYQALASNQHWNSRVLTSKRGDILSSDNFPLATTKNFYLLFAEPKKVDNVERRVLSRYTMYAAITWYFC